MKITEKNVDKSQDLCLYCLTLKSTDVLLTFLKNPEKFSRSRLGVTGHHG
jgi:hypothetical protein